MLKGLIDRNKDIFVNSYKLVLQKITSWICSLVLSSDSLSTSSLLENFSWVSTGIFWWTFCWIAGTSYNVWQHFFMCSFFLKRTNLVHSAQHDQHLCSCTYCHVSPQKGGIAICVLKKCNLIYTGWWIHYYLYIMFFIQQSWSVQSL